MLLDIRYGVLGNAVLKEDADIYFSVVFDVGLGCMITVKAT